VLQTCNVDLVTGRLSDGRAGTLTGRELALLTYLTERQGEVVSREELTVRVFGYSPHARTRAVDKAVHSLRRKIEARPSDPEHVLTCAGAGYRFVPLPPDLPYLRSSESLVGRARHLARLRALLAPGSIVTVRGPPGIGKTRLVIELLRDLDGRLPAVWVDLEDVRTETGLETRPGRAVGGRDDRPLDELLAEPGPRVWVLDGDRTDFDLSPTLERWRATTPDACWVRTSTRSLGCRDEQVAVLDPLPLEDATRLFGQRSLQRGYPLPDGELVRELVEKLDGLPLAIVLAADRIGPLGVADLARGLERGELDLLDWRPIEGGSTLRERLTGEWSRLDQGDRSFLRFLASEGEPVRVSKLTATPGLLESAGRLVEASWLHCDDVEGHARLGISGATTRFVGQLRAGRDGAGGGRPPGDEARPSAPAVLLPQALAELEGTGPGEPSGPAMVDLVERLASVVHTRVSRVLLRHAAHLPKTDLRQEIEDQVQAVFVQLFADRARVLRAWDPNRGASLVNWVGRFSQMRTIDAIRRGMRGPWFHDAVDPTYFDDGELLDPNTPEDAGIAHGLWSETRRRVLEQESAAGRQMFVWLFDEERTVDEIEEATGRTRASILKWHSRLRGAVRRELAGLMSGDRHDEAG